jgi:C1A family cysteine protease
MKSKIITVFILLMLIILSFNVGADSSIDNKYDCNCISKSGEDQQYYLGDIFEEGLGPKGVCLTGDTPNSFDWRNVDGNDWTTPVKEQGQCGSCYAFGIYAALESAVKIKLGNPELNVDFSEQYMVSCGYQSGYCYGCDGGSPTPTYNFVKEFGAVPESFFSYTSGDTGVLPSCENELYDDFYDFKTDIVDWHWVSSDVESIKNALIEYGPLPTSMVVHGDFEAYPQGCDNGIYKHPGDESDEDTNHRVTIVGYNDNQQYWICKNSWGKDWGDNGWFKIAYGDCRIEDFTVYFELEDVTYNEVDISVTMHRIKQGDEIDPWPHGEADWSYRFSVYNGLVLRHKKNNNYCDEDDDHQEDITHTFHVHCLSNTPTILVKAWDRDDVLKDHDLADVSPKSGGGSNNKIHDLRSAMFHCKYDIVNNELVESDGNTHDGEWIKINGDGENKAELWFKITDSYNPPKPDAGGPYFGLQNFDITLSGSAKSGVPPYSYAWNLDDDGSFDDGDSQSITHSWSTTGTHTVKLKVTDIFDVSKIDETTVTIDKNDAPTKPNIQGPSTGSPETPIKYSFTATDPDSQYGDKIFYKIDWGDGSITEWLGPYDSGYKLEKSHSWEKQKSHYTLRAKTKDLSDSESSWESMEVTMPRTFNPILDFIKRFPIIYRALISVINLID